MFFAAIAVCAFSTATFAGEVKEVKAEIKEVSEKIEEVVLHTACGAAWIAAYDGAKSLGASYDAAVAHADQVETACRNASISAN